MGQVLWQGSYQGLPCELRELDPGSELVDSWESFSRNACEFLLSQHKLGVGRYLENGTVEEIVTILQSGLGYYPISNSAEPGWKPTGTGGTDKGNEMVGRAAALTLPPELPLTVDYEGPDPTTSVADATAWLVNCGTQILASGRTNPMLYVGWCQILSGEQLYELEPYTRYYASSPGNLKLPCGYCLVQTHENVKLGNLLVDLDTVQADTHSPPRLPVALFLAETPSQAAAA
jgi:hypothetical protein